MHTCIHAYVHRCICIEVATLGEEDHKDVTHRTRTCTHAHMPTCPHACMPTCPHACMPTCPHAYAGEDHRDVLTAASDLAELLGRRHQTRREAHMHMHILYI